MAPTPKTIQCPACKTTLQWDSSAPYRPFCSETCKNKDFMSWTNEEHRVAGNCLYDDVHSADLMLGE